MAWRVTVVVVVLAACSPAVSMPDGVACAPMVYVSTDLGDPDVWLLDGDGARGLTDQGLRDLNPAFSPDGKRIAFTQGSSDLDLVLRTMAADGSDVATEWEDADLSVSSVDWGEAGLVVDAFSEDVALQVFTVLDGLHPITSEGINGKPTWAGDRILHLHLDGPDGLQDLGYTGEDGTFTNLTNSPDSRDVLGEASPDGTSIAFASDRSGSFDIWVMDPDGASPRPLTDGPDEESNPTWSSDGAHILYTVGVDDTAEIWVMGSDGSDPRRIGPGWVPDCP